MTRDEALKFILENSREDYNNHCVVMPIEKVTELKNKIYDDFESRVCKNCKYAEYIDKNYILCTNTKHFGDSQVFEKDFGCIEFERKDK